MIRSVGIAAAVAAAALGGCGSGGGRGDLTAFCRSVEALQDDDPFADLQVASPEEMRSAFDALTAGVQRIDDAAPPEAQIQASTYLATVDELTDQLRGAGYDPRDLDGLAYRQAAADYETAAVSVENAADSLCP